MTPHAGRAPAAPASHSRGRGGKSCECRRPRPWAQSLCPCLPGLRQRPLGPSVSSSTQLGPCAAPLLTGGLTDTRQPSSRLPLGGRGRVPAQQARGLGGAGQGRSAVLPELAFVFPVGAWWAAGPPTTRACLTHRPPVCPQPGLLATAGPLWGPKSPSPPNPEGLVCPERLLSSAGGRRRTRGSPAPSHTRTVPSPASGL